MKDRINRSLKYNLETVSYTHLDVYKRQAASSANSMLAVINSFFRFSGWHDCCVKRLKTQAKVYCTEEKELTKEEYIRLVRTAERNGNERLSLIIQTICSTGIRVSELKYITVQALADGEAQVNCKGKIRMVFIAVSYTHLDVYKR